MFRVLQSPKQSYLSRNREWYPYYAGYTEAFVEDVLARHLADASNILDPWNGSGTTTAVCQRLGRSSVGVDLNPALAVIARARLTPTAAGPSLLPLAKKILAAARHFSRSPDEGDLLLKWMRPDAASRIRGVQAAIHSHLTDARCALVGGPSQWAERLPHLAAFYYCALFATVRGMLLPFRTTNPTWLTEPSHARCRVAPSWQSVRAAFLDRTAYLRERLSVDPSETGASCSLYTASADKLPFKNAAFDGVISSPPYATRIDYVKGTLPELAVLGVSEEELSLLRTRTTGTPVVAGHPKQCDVSSPYAQDLIELISGHRTKGSAAYYGPWIDKYFSSLAASLRETNRVVKSGSPIAIVVQDSYYKELRIDLQRVVVEIMSALGRRTSIRHDYAAKNLLSNMHPFARKHAQKRANTESLLVFH